MKTPWLARNKPTDGQDATVLASRFVLGSPWRVPGFFRHAMRAWRQALAAPGNLGVALNAQPLRLTFWTLSAWASEKQMYDFVRAEPHRTIMRTAGPWSRESTFKRWSVPAGQVPADRAAAGLWAEVSARVTSDKLRRHLDAAVVPAYQGAPLARHGDHDLLRPGEAAQPGILERGHQPAQRIRVDLVHLARFCRRAGIADQVALG